jgi:hypothetical protein
MYDAQPSWIGDEPYPAQFEDDRPDRWFYDDGCRRFEPGGDRLVHLVQVDGRLVDCWTEPVERSRYAHYAEQFDAERRPLPIEPPRPRTPQYAVALAWLDDLVGGRPALLSLTGERLPAPAAIPLDDLPLAARHRLEGVLARLDQTRAVFNDEVGDLLLRLLSELWAADPEIVTGAADADRVVGGMIWVVGKANDLFNAAAGMPQTRVQKALNLRSSLVSYGPKVHQELRGLTDRWIERPWSQRELLSTGRPDLLTARTRRRLIRVRDQALAAEKEALATTGPVLP